MTFAQNKFKIVLWITALVVPFICGGIILSLTMDASPAFSQFGFLKFIFSDQWNYTPGHESYGALPFITGTLLTTVLALAFCLPFSLPVALFNGEYYKGTKTAGILGTVTDLLAGIPSIIYGLWGFYVLRPIVVELGLSEQGSGILTAALVLAVMIIPYAASLSAEFIKMIPSDLKEGAYSLGATRAEVIRNVVFPCSRFGYLLGIHIGHRQSSRRNHDSNHAHRQYQSDAPVGCCHWQYDGKYHRQSIRRSRRTEIVIAHRHRTAALSDYGCHQSYRKDAYQESLGTIKVKE
jgi:ABC-type phosphate transport system permease subunit